MQPGNRHLLLSSQALHRKGWVLESWATETEDARGVWEKNPVSAPEIPIFKLFFFTFLATRQLRKRRLHEDPNTLVYTDGARCLSVDLAQFNYVNESWVKIALKNKFWLSGRAAFKLSLSWAVALMERLQIKQAQRFIVPSRGAAKDLQNLSADSARLKVLPYSLDTELFNLETRRSAYTETRQALGFTPENLVFGFISQGHFARKGLPQAIQALSEARNRSEEFRNHARFLVVGGHPKPLARFQKQLDKTCPDWKEWIRFTGLLTDSAEVIPGMNAFLFPSFYETYGIVTAECAAMGIPILLTRHCGSEMTMRDGKNGLYIPWEPRDLSELLLRYYQGETPLGALRREDMWLPQNFEADAGEILSRPDYERELLDFLETALQEKRSRFHPK